MRTMAFVLAFYIAIPVVLHGCGSPIVSHSHFISESFCDGDQLAVICVDKKSVTGNRITTHSGGYLISNDEDSWLVNWKINKSSESAVDFKPIVRHLGHYSQRPDTTSGNMSTIATGLAPEMYHVTSSPDTLLHFSRGSSSVQIVTAVGQTVVCNMSNPSPVGLPAIIVSRSRKYAYISHPQDAVYSLPDWKLVRRLQEDDSLRKVKKIISERSRFVVLTEDGSALLVVSNASSVIDVSSAEHEEECTIYDFTKATTETARFSCGDGEQLIDAELVGSEVEVAKYTVLYESRDIKWTVLDFCGKILSVAQFKSPLNGTYSRNFWTPRQDTLWMVEYMPLQTKTSVVLRRFDLSTGLHSETKFALPELVIPAAK